LTPSSRYSFAVKSYYTMLTSHSSEEPSYFIHLEKHLEGEGSSPHCLFLMGHSFWLNSHSRQS